MPTTLPAGAYLYFDAFEGAPAQRVEVTHTEGEVLARFLEAEPEDGEVVLPVRDMAGRFEPLTA